MRRALFRPSLGDVSGALADLGTLVPLLAALVVVNGLEPGPALVVAGALVVAAGLVFRIPFPVQPLKALTAIAVARALDPGVIHAAGLQIGAVFLLLSATGLADRLARWFTLPVIRALQFGVGVLLVRSALRLTADPPPLFAAAPSPGWSLALSGVALAAVALAAWRRWHLAVLGLFAAGVVAGWVAATPHLGEVAVRVPTVEVPAAADFPTAFALLVVPQVPLTFGNAVVGVSHLAREVFGERARRVTPGRVAFTCGLGNVVAGSLGGVPLCHGSSGFSAHVRLGARTAAMNLGLGTALATLGLVFSRQVVALFAVLPVWVLGAFLAYAGLRHAGLVLDLRGRALAVALAAGGAGVVTENLAVTTALALLVEHARPRRPLRKDGRARS